MKKAIFTTLILLIATFVMAQSITNINPVQRTDGSMIVDITYDLDGPDPYYTIVAEVSMDGGASFLPMNTVTGDVGPDIAPGFKSITWEFGSDYPGVFSSNSLIRIIASVSIPNIGLEAYYPFNGNANDESGNGNHGTPFGSAALTTDRFENLNSAYFFDGINSHIEIGDIFDTLSSLSITAWVLFAPNSQGAFRSIISKHGDYGSFSGKSFNLVKFGNDNKISSRHYSSNELVECKDIDQVNIGEWLFVASTYGEGVAKLYINGYLVDSQAASFVIQNTSTPVLIGDNATNNHPFLGKIDDVRIYSRVLTLGEIELLLNE